MTEIFAHRGSAHLARENTVEAFVAARELGADGIELDVHLTSDGVVVVHHDPELAGKGPISSLAARELPPWLPTLLEALEACLPLKVNVEIKAGSDSQAPHDELVFEVASLLASRSEAARIVVSSFSLAAIDSLHDIAPGLATALLVEPADDATKALETAHRHGHRGLHPFFPFVDEALVKQATRMEIAVRPWTVDDPARVVELARLGVDAVITNDVAAALHALGRA